MDRKSFFNKYYAMNADGSKACRELNKVARLLFDKWCGEERYSPRELASILISELTLVEATWVILYAYDKHKEEESLKNETKST